MAEHNKTERSFAKKVGIDILGVLMIIGAGLFGWIPGPGGIPLFLAGLGLLATNHEWARRLLDRIKRDGLNLFERFFNDHPVITALYDVVSVLLIVLAVWVFTSFTNNLAQSTAIVFAFVALGLFLGNRKRLQRITAKFKRSTKS